MAPPELHCHGTRGGPNDWTGAAAGSQQKRHQMKPVPMNGLSLTSYHIWWVDWYGAVFQSHSWTKPDNLEGREALTHFLFPQWLQH